LEREFRREEKRRGARLFDTPGLHDLRNRLHLTSSNVDNQAFISAVLCEGELKTVDIVNAYDECLKTSLTVSRSGAATLHGLENVALNGLIGRVDGYDAPPKRL